MVAYILIPALERRITSSRPGWTGKTHLKNREKGRNKGSDTEVCDVVQAGQSPEGCWSYAKPRVWRHGKILTLYNDEGRGMDAVHAVGCKARVLAAIALGDVLYIQSSRGSDIHSRVNRQGCPVTSRPRDLRQRVPCGTALQSDTLTHQYLCVLRLDYKSGSGCHEQKFPINFVQLHEISAWYF